MATLANGALVESILNVETANRQDAIFINKRPFSQLVVDYPVATSQNLLEAESTPVDGIAKKTHTPKELDNGYLAEGSTVGWETWFESFHILPRNFDFGNILSNQNSDVEVYSAFRRVDHDWTAFVSNAGDGVTLSGLPSLPHTFVPQSNGGLTLELQVSTSGQSTVNTTLDYTFGTVSQVIQTPIELIRVVLFSIQPELPYTEKLQWLTKVLTRIKGTEQRISSRKNPRQLFEWNFIMEDGPERAFFHNVMFDWQARTFGLPMWHELTRLSSAATVTDTTLTVQSTDYADYRVGGLVLIFESRSKFDVLELSSLTPTSLVLVSGVLNAYPSGALVMPLRTGNASRLVSGSRFVSADARMRIQFRVSDNDADLADTAAFNSFNSKVYINACNNVRGQMSEQFERDLVVVDNQTGVPIVSSRWDVGKRITQLALLGKGKQGLWELRQLLHALRGKQISFYVCSFSKDFTIDSDITAGTTINVANVGYTQFVQNRAPRDLVRIIYNNGDADDIRTISSSSVVDSTREALVLDSAVASHTAAQVEKIMFVEKVRWDSDEISIRHEIGDTTTRVSGPIKTVLE